MIAPAGREDINYCIVDERLFKATVGHLPPLSVWRDRHKAQGKAQNCFGILHEPDGYLCLQIEPAGYVLSPDELVSRFMDRDWIAVGTVNREILEFDRFTCERHELPQLIARAFGVYHPPKPFVGGPRLYEFASAVAFAQPDLEPFGTVTSICADCGLGIPQAQGLRVG